MTGVEKLLVKMSVSCIAMFHKLAWRSCVSSVLRCVWLLPYPERKMDVKETEVLAIYQPLPVTVYSVANCRPQLGNTVEKPPPPEKKAERAIMRPDKLVSSYIMWNMYLAAFSTMSSSLSTLLFQISQEISKKYKNRPVNIMGEINNINRLFISCLLSCRLWSLNLS